MRVSMADNTRTGIIGLFLALIVGAGVGTGGTLYLAPNELSYAYVCNVSTEVGIFYGGISSTAYTAYPYAENRTGQKTCIKGTIKGVWQPCSSYASARNVTCATLIQPSPEPTTEIVMRQQIVDTRGNVRSLICTEA